MDGDGATKELVTLIAAATQSDDDEHTVNIIALLFQAYDATAGLIGNTLLAAARHQWVGDIDGLVAETIRFDGARAEHPACRLRSAAESSNLDATGFEIAVSRLDEFSALHRPGNPLVLPNALDVASALLFEEAGFLAVGTTSLGITAAAGLADSVGLGKSETLRLAEILVSRLRVPLTIDCESGFGDDPAEIAAMARQVANIGIAGINIEDGIASGELRAVDRQAAIIAAIRRAAPELLSTRARTPIGCRLAMPLSVRPSR